MKAHMKAAPEYGVLILRRADGTFAFDTCAMTLEQTILRSARKGETFTEARNRLYQAGWTVCLFGFVQQEDMYRTFTASRIPVQVRELAFYNAPLADPHFAPCASPLEGYEPLGPRVLRRVRERVWEPVRDGIGRYGTRQLARWGIRWEWKTEEKEGEGKTEEK
jgi:hypothetical protein